MCPPGFSLLSLFRRVLGQFQGGDQGAALVERLLIFAFGNRIGNDARARLVILDEASSRLDPATEQIIERTIDKLLHNRTAIIVAHRLGTVQRADEIMILEGGQVTEHGERARLAADPSSRFYGLLQTGLSEVLV